RMIGVHRLRLEHRVEVGKDHRAGLEEVDLVSVEPAREREVQRLELGRRQEPTGSAAANASTDHTAQMLVRALPPESDHRRVERECESSRKTGMEPEVPIRQNALHA